MNEAVLRGQSQAAYSPDNLGHFGLALPRYAHFTSPIRRYADLLVHRALIRGLKLGTDGLDETEAARFPDTAEHITSTERRAAAAERDAVDRYLAAHMAQRIGESFEARISGSDSLRSLRHPGRQRGERDRPARISAGRSMGLGRGRTTAGRSQDEDDFPARAMPWRRDWPRRTPRTGGMVFHLMQGIPARGQSRPAGKARRRDRQR